MPNQTHDKIAQAQKFKDQFKYEEALETLNSIENANGFSVDEQIRFNLLRSDLFLHTGQDNKALDAANWVFQESLKTGNDLVKLDASLIRGWVLYSFRKYKEGYNLRKYKECNNTILKCEELISMIKNQPEKIIGKRKAELSIIKMHYFAEIGELEKSFEYIKTNLSLIKMYGTKLHICSAFNLIGYLYAKTGDFTKALENYETSMKISKEINFKPRMITTNNNIGYLFFQRGDLDRALEYYEKSRSLYEEGGYKWGKASNLIAIGEILYEKGELTKALNYARRGSHLFKEIGYIRGLWTVSFKIILIYLDQNELESARTYLEELKNLREIEENKRLTHRYRIAKALILKKTGGTRNIIKAEDILNQLLEDKSVENELLVVLLLNLIELIYKELQITNEIEILEEIRPLIAKLLEISEKMHSFSLLAEVNIFKAKYKLINLELDESQQLLTKAQQIAQKYTLFRLGKKISMEHDQLLEKLDIWKELKEINAPISERLNLVSFEGDLNLMMRKKEIEQVKILPEEPQLLSIISNGGMSLFTHFFSKKWDDIMMFGSFMTAFNMFSNEFFSKTLDRVKIGENTIIMVPFEDKFLCYVFKGQTYPAQQKINKFSEGIKNSKEILDAINRCFSTGAILNNENAPGLGKLVSTIFA